MDFHSPFMVGDWWVDSRARQIKRDGDERYLEPKVMSLLVRLCEDAGRPVSREELLTSVWPDTVVSEDALNRIVSQLRKALDDDADRQRVIRTVPKTGYRLVATVTLDASEPVDEKDRSGPSDEGTDRMVLSIAERRPWLAAAGALGLVALIGLASALDSSRAGHEVLSVRPVTNYRGLEVHPAVERGAQDNRVAYAWQGESGDNWDIYLNVFDAGSPVRLTEHSARDLMPAWSPDGRHIAFVRLDGAVCSIRVMPSSGGESRSLAPCGSVSDMVWHPDGTRLLISESPDANDPARIRALGVEDGRTRDLTHPPDGTPGDVFIGVSPAGGQLAFARSSAPGVMDLYRIQLDYSEPVRLTNDGAKIHGLDWTTNGENIVYSSNRGHGSFDLWTVPATGGEPSTFLVGPADVDGPSFGTAGRHVAFEVWTTRTSLYLLGGEPGGAKRLTESNSVDWHPDLSPDGAWIAFASNRSGFAQLWRAGVDGSEPTQLTNLKAAYVSAPRWSPDGARLAYEARPDGQGDIFILDEDESIPRRLTDHPSEDRFPGWSSDGTWVYFASRRSGEWQVWKTPAEGGDPVQVTAHGGYVASETSDGRLVLTRHDRAGLWIYHENTGKYDLITDTVQPIDARNWTTAGRNLLFIGRTMDETPAVVRMDPEGRIDTLAAEIEALYYKSGLTAAADGSRIVFTRIEEHDSDIHILGTAGTR